MLSAGPTMSHMLGHVMTEMVLEGCNCIKVVDKEERLEDGGKQYLHSAGVHQLGACLSLLVRDLLESLFLMSMPLSISDTMTMQAQQVLLN